MGRGRVRRGGEWWQGEGGGGRGGGSLSVR